MASNYVPVAGGIQVISGFNEIKKYALPTTARAFQSGSPLWNNGAGGVEPPLQQTGSTVNIIAAQVTFAQLFVGLAAGARVPQQLATVAQFSAPGDAPETVDDASQPFLSAHDEGVAQAPCDALGAQVEIGAMVAVAGFTNEAATGFYTPDGTLTKDTKHYLYNNKVVVTTNSAAAIGTVVERALAGATSLKFQFSGVAYRDESYNP